MRWKICDCGVEDLSVKLKQRKLRWFGHHIHVKREEGGVLGEVGEVRVGGDGQQEGLGKIE